MMTADVRTRSARLTTYGQVRSSNPERPEPWSERHRQQRPDRSPNGTSDHHVSDGSAPLMWRVHFRRRKAGKAGASAGRSHQREATQEAEKGVALDRPCGDTRAHGTQRKSGLKGVPAPHAVHGIAEQERRAGDAQLENGGRGACPFRAAAEISGDNGVNCA